MSTRCLPYCLDPRPGRIRTRNNIATTKSTAETVRVQFSVSGVRGGRKAYIVSRIVVTAATSEDCVVVDFGDGSHKRVERGVDTLSNEEAFRCRFILEIARLQTVAERHDSFQSRPLERDESHFRIVVKPLLTWKLIKGSIKTAAISSEGMLKMSESESGWTNVVFPLGPLMRATYSALLTLI